MDHSCDRPTDHQWHVEPLPHWASSGLRAFSSIACAGVCVSARSLGPPACGLGRAAWLRNNSGARSWKLTVPQRRAFQAQKASATIQRECYATMISFLPHSRKNAFTVAGSLVPALDTMTPRKCDQTARLSDSLLELMPINRHVLRNRARNK